MIFCCSLSVPDRLHVFTFTPIPSQEYTEIK